MQQDRVVLLGGAGTIGEILHEGLSPSYDVIVADLKHPQRPAKNFIRLDVTDYESVVKNLPEKTKAIINLVGLDEYPAMVSVHDFNRMCDAYVTASYNILLAAVQRGIPRVVMASTNHVTDAYETNGFSLLGREITVNDLPRTHSVYGALKYAAESLGYVVHVQTGLSVISIRIGTVRIDQKSALATTPRFHRTLLSLQDTVAIFDKAIRSTVGYGVYYGVSENPDKPWSLDNAMQDLGYCPRTNSCDVVKENE